jgi:hypothetical protein
MPAEIVCKILSGSPKIFGEASKFLVGLLEGNIHYNMNEYGTDLSKGGTSDKVASRKFDLLNSRVV